MHGAAERPVLAHHVLVVATARPLVVEGAQALDDRTPHRAAAELEGPALEREALVLGDSQLAGARVVVVLVRRARGGVVACTRGRVGLELCRAPQRRLAVARAVAVGLGHAEGQVVVTLRRSSRRGGLAAVPFAPISRIQVRQETERPGAGRRKPDAGREQEENQGSVIHRQSHPTTAAPCGCGNTGKLHRTSSTSAPERSAFACASAAAAPQTFTPGSWPGGSGI